MFTPANDLFQLFFLFRPTYNWFIQREVKSDETKLTQKTEKKKKKNPRFFFM